MNRFFLQLSILSFLMLSLGSCASQKNRNPSGLKSAVEGGVSTCRNAMIRFFYPFEKGGNELLVGQAAHKKITQIYVKRPTIWWGVVRQGRDKLRKQLQIWNNHPYSVLGIDEAPRAYAWSRKAFNLLSPKELEVMNDEALQKIQEDLVAYITKAKAYPREIQEIADEAVDINTELAALTNYLDRMKVLGNEVPSHDIAIDIPLVRGDQIVYDRIIYGSEVQIKIRIRDLKAAWATQVKKAFDRGVEQADLIKKVETYRHELIRAQSEIKEAKSIALSKRQIGFQQGVLPEDTLANKNDQIPEDYQRILDDIHDLFTGKDAKRVKSEYAPSPSAWNVLKWEQFWQELRDYHYRKFPGDDDSLKNRMDEIVNFVKAMPEAQLRAIGVSKPGDGEKLTRFKEGRALRVVGTFVTGGLAAGGSGFSLFKATNSIWEYYSREQICAEKESESEFQACAEKLLEERFSTKFVMEKSEKGNLLQSNGDYSDPEVAAAAWDLLNRRNQFMLDLRVKEEMRESVRRQLLGADMVSEAFRERLINEGDEAWFRERFLSEDPKTGYLALSFPIAYKQASIRGIIHQAFEVRENAELRQAFLAQLDRVPAAQKIKKEVEEILSARVDAQARYLQAQKVRDDLLRSFSAQLEPRNPSPRDTPGEEATAPAPN